MDEMRNGGSRTAITLLLVASAASLVATGLLVPETPDLPTRIGLVLPFALLALPLAARRITPALRRAIITSGAGPFAMLRHVTLPLCGPIVLPVWLLAIAVIAIPAMPYPLPGAATWAAYALLVLATYAGLIRNLTAPAAT